MRPPPTISRFIGREAYAARACRIVPAARRQARRGRCRSPAARSRRRDSGRRARRWARGCRSRRPAALARRSTSSITARELLVGRAAERVREVVGADEDEVDALDLRGSRRGSRPRCRSRSGSRRRSRRGRWRSLPRAEAVEGGAAGAGAAPALRRVAGELGGGVRRLGGVDQRHEHAGGAAVEGVADRARRRRGHAHERRDAREIGADDHLLDVTRRERGVLAVGDQHVVADRAHDLRDGPVRRLDEAGDQRCVVA